MKMMRGHHRTWVALLGLLILFSPNFTASANDGHDEASAQGSYKFAGTDLHIWSVSLLSQIDERDKQIRRGLETGQIEFNGEIFLTKPNATEEFVCGVSSLNNRLELLSKAKEFINAINKLSDVREQDKDEVANIKERLEKAVAEFVKVDEQKKQRAKLEFSRLKDEIGKELTAFKKQETKTPLSSRIKDLLSELKNIPDLSAEDSTERSQLIEKITSHIKSAEKPQDQTGHSLEQAESGPFKSIGILSPFRLLPRAENKDLEKLADEIDYELQSRGLTSLEDELLNPYKITYKSTDGRMNNWPSTLSKLQSFSSQLDNIEPLSEKDLKLKAELKEKLTKTVENVKTFLKESSSANILLAEDKGKNKPTSPETQPPPTPEKIAELENKLSKTEKETKEIESHLRNEKDLGVNLELEYRLNLERLETYRRSLESQINEARSASHNPPPPILNRVENDSTTQSTPPEIPARTSNELNQPTPQPFNSNNAAKPKEASSSGSVKSPNNLSNSNSAQKSPNPLPLSDTEIPNNRDKTTSRISSLDQPGVARHLSSSDTQISGNSNSSNGGQSTNGILNNRSSNIKGENLFNKANSKTKNIAANTNNQKSIKNGEIIEQNSMINDNSNLTFGKSGSQMVWGGGPQLSRPPNDNLLANSSNNKSSGTNPAGNSNDLAIGSKNQLGDYQGKDIEQTESGLSDDSYSLRKRSKKGLVTSNGKRRQNESSAQTSLPSSTDTVFTSSYVTEEKKSLNKITDTSYIKNPDGTFSKAPQSGENVTDASRRLIFKAEQGIPSTINLPQEGSEKVMANLNVEPEFQLDLNTADENPSRSILEMTGLKTTIDSIGKFLEELYPASRTQKQSEISKLLKLQNGVTPKTARVLAQTREEKPTPEPQLVVGSENEIQSRASLLNRFLAWVGFN